jgi:hypothetical protein
LALLANGTSLVALRAVVDSVWSVYLEPGNGASPSMHPLALAPPRGRWTHLSLTVVFAAAPAGSVLLRIDQASALQLSAVTTLATGFAALRLVAGVQQVASPTPAVTVAYDDVTLSFGAP